MQRPSRFEHQRFVGDKRSQVVYDLDEWDDQATIDELMSAETFLCFGPDSLLGGPQPWLPAGPPGPPPPAPVAPLTSRR